MSDCLENKKLPLCKKRYFPADDSLGSASADEVQPIGVLLCVAQVLQILMFGLVTGIGPASWFQKVLTPKVRFV